MTSHIPFVSVILPLRNEELYIERGLLAILSQDYPLDHIEILIADGMSTDRTPEIVRRFAALYPAVKIHLLQNPGKIVPTGLNLALHRAVGEMILRVDGHTAIAPDYVRQCVLALQRSGADNVGGRMDAYGSSLFGQAVALATSTPFGVGGSRFHYLDQEEMVDTVYMGAWPRRVFEKIGLFDEELVRDQDDEFNYRLRAHGGRILLSPAIRSEYIVRSTPRTLWRQYYQYGYWKVRVLQKHPRQMSLRQFVPPAFVFSLFISLFLLFYPFPTFILHPSLFLPLAYLVANLAASAITTLRPPSSISQSPISQLLLPIVYAILHISYGLGFLIGLLVFAHRWGDRQGRTPILARKDA